MEKPCYGKPLEEHLTLSGREIAFPIEACVTVLLDCGLQEEVNLHCHYTHFSGFCILFHPETFIQILQSNTVTDIIKQIVVVLDLRLFKG